MAGDSDDEDIVTGTEGEGTDGSDTTGRDEESDVSAERAGEAGPDGDEVQEDEVAEDEPPPRSARGVNRLQRLANERNELREQVAQTRREMEEIRRQSVARQTQESEETRQARRALMTPEERMQDDLAAVRREFAEQQKHMQFQTASMMDKASYDAKATVNTVYAKYRNEVEKLFQEQMALGRPVEREHLLQYHLGKLALESAGRSGGQRRQAKARVESQRVSAGSGKGDEQSQRGKAGDTPESRLKGVLI